MRKNETIELAIAGSSCRIARFKDAIQFEVNIGSLPLSERELHQKEIDRRERSFRKYIRDLLKEIYQREPREVDAKISTAIMQLGRLEKDVLTRTQNLEIIKLIETTLKSI